MELSKEWYHTELTNSEYDMLHRSPTVEYSFESSDRKSTRMNYSNVKRYRMPSSA